MNMNPEIEGIIKNFLEVLEKLIQRFGADPVAAALEELLPGFTFELQPDVSGQIGDLEPVTLPESKLGRVTKGGKGLLRKTKDWISSKMTRSPKTTAGAGGAAGGAAAGSTLGRIGGAIAAGGAAVVGKNWDQDVNIDDITTDKALNVKSKTIEDLLIKNQEAIQKMIQVMTQTQQELSKKLSDLDKSVDYMATGEDESPEAVDVRQDLGLSRIKPGKNKSSEKEKEKKAKEMEKARKRDLPTV